MARIGSTACDAAMREKRAWRERIIIIAICVLGAVPVIVASLWVGRYWPFGLPLP